MNIIYNLKWGNFQGVTFKYTRKVAINWYINKWGECDIIQYDRCHHKAVNKGAFLASKPYVYDINSP